jgi:hypothetical protein
MFWFPTERSSTAIGSGPCATEAHKIVNYCALLQQHFRQTL